MSLLVTLQRKDSKEMKKHRSYESMGLGADRLENFDRPRCSGDDKVIHATWLRNFWCVLDLQIRPPVHAAISRFGRGGHGSELSAPQTWWEIQDLFSGP